jgi:hypothetical protein
MSRYILSLACALFVAGCGNADTSSVDNYIKQMAQATCQWQYRCCTDAEIKLQEGTKYMDEPTCEKFAQLALTDSMALEKLGVKQGRIHVDQQQAQACIAQLTAKDCNPAPGSMTPPMMTMECAIDPCSAVFVGSTASNEACLLDGECAKGSHCVGANAGAEGVCVPYQQENQICNSSSDCDPSVCNLYCSQQDFQCHVRSPIGGPCAYTMDPVSGMPTLPVLLECDNSMNNVYCDPMTNTCQQLPGAGQPCLSQPPPGVFRTCDPDPKLGLVCDTSGGGGMGICRGPGMLGDDCTTLPCSTKDMLYCDRTMTPNTCKALPTLGQPCQGAGFQCQSPYYCNTTGAPPYLCAQPAQLGQTCSFTMRCDNNLYCDMMSATPTCKSQLPDGSTCTQSNMCQSGICTFNGTGQVCGQGTMTVQCVGR